MSDNQLSNCFYAACILLDLNRNSSLNELRDEDFIAEQLIAMALGLA